MMSTALKAECYAKALGLDRTGMKSICAQTYKIQRTGSSVIRGQETMDSCLYHQFTFFPAYL